MPVIDSAINTRIPDLTPKLIYFIPAFSRDFISYGMNRCYKGDDAKCVAKGWAEKFLMYPVLRVPLWP